MGLSNEERFSKLFWSIHRITQIAADLPTGPGIPYGYEAQGIARLKDLSDKLWEAFIGAKRNSGYWIMGGDAGNPVKAPEGAWSAAIVALCDGHREDPSRADLDEEGRPFDPFDGFLDVEGLLGQSEEGNVRKDIYELYGWTEVLAYALRRYDDEMAAGLKKLNKLAADLQGTCYSLFVHDEVFGRAYVLNRVLEALYGGRYDNPHDPDPVRALFLGLHMHHDLSRPMTDGSLKEIIGWDKWRQTNPMTPENRLVLALRICGRRFHYDHQFKEVVEASKKLKPQPRVKVLEAEFAKCKKAHEADGKERMDGYRDRTNLEINYVIHGFECHDWDKKKTLKKVEKAPKKVARKGKK